MEKCEICENKEVCPWLESDIARIKSNLYLCLTNWLTEEQKRYIEELKQKFWYLEAIKKVKWCAK